MPPAGVVDPGPAHPAAAPAGVVDPGPAHPAAAPAGVVEPGPAHPAVVPAGGPDRIELRGLRALGTHGALPEERVRAQPFEVALDLLADVAAAAVSDDLADTVDYGAVSAAVAAALTGPHAELLEHLAERVAAAALAAAGRRAVEVAVTVRKLRPPVPEDLASAAVTLRRRPVSR